MHEEKLAGYWLFYAYRFAAYAFTEKLRQFCAEHGKPYAVTPPQWGLLSLLYGQDGLTVGTISQRRVVDAPTITGIVTRLEQNGLVSRQRDDKDRRVVKVYLTDEGRAITGLLFEVVEKMNEAILHGFSGEEKRDLLTMLQRIVTNVTAEIPDGDNRWNVLSKIPID
jgi:DNA-binding MarR family transcriptional regulator